MSLGNNLLLALLLCLISPLFAVERIPIEDLIKDPTFDEIRLSPDGTRISALARWKGHLQLFVIDIKTKRPTQITGYQLVDVDSVSWRDNQTLSYTTIQDRIPTGRWMLASADGKSIKDDETPWIWRSTLHSDIEHPDLHVLQEYSESENALFIYDYNAKKRTKRRREKIPYAWTGYVDTHNAVLIAAGGMQREVADRKGPDAKFERFLYARDKEGAPWMEVFRWRYDECTFEVLGFDKESRYAYVITNHNRDTRALVLFDFRKGMIEKLLVEDPVYDIDDVIFARDGKTLLGCTLVRDQLETVWLDERMKNVQAIVDQEFPGNQNTFSSMSEDLGKVVILSRNDRDPGAYYFLDVKTLEMQMLVRRMPWLKPESLAVMKPVLYKARDGLDIHAYLTLPPGAEARMLPMVVLPHGGPWTRDDKAWDLDAQFLANRGYAVFQMNFRGSTGYGRRHLSLGVGEWGQSMQDDVTDGVKWAISEGIADPGRIAIYGASYGGFAALAGLAKTPELYRCGVSYVGVTDIELFFKSSIPWEMEDPGINMKLIGNPKYNKEKFRDVSPLRIADKIRAPVFLAYGERDPIVDHKHGTRMAAALRSRGVPVEWMVRSQEGHGYREPANMIDYYNTLETFLATHLAKKD